MRWSASVALLIALCGSLAERFAQPATEAEGPDESAEGPQSIEDLDPADIENAHGIACEVAGMELTPNPTGCGEMICLTLFCSSLRGHRPQGVFRGGHEDLEFLDARQGCDGNPLRPPWRRYSALVRAEAMRFLPEELASAMHFRVDLWVGGSLRVLCEVPSRELPPVGPIALPGVGRCGRASQKPVHSAARRRRSGAGRDPVSSGGGEPMRSARGRRRGRALPRRSAWRGTQLWALGLLPWGIPIGA